MTLLTLKVVLGCHLTIKIKIFKVNNKINRNIFVPTLCGLSKQTLSQLIYQRFGHVSITRLKQMARE